MGLRLVRADKKPATVMRLVVRELLGIGAPMMLLDISSPSGASSYGGA
ncbi:hypothetical protein [Allobaculum sp. Allo2]|nr:hypothetical protein [Allobaculum sp. Allo2]